MESRRMVWLGVAVFSTIGSLIPMLWGGSLMGGWSLFLSVVGAFVGIYVGYKVSKM